MSDCDKNKPVFSLIGYDETVLALLAIMPWKDLQSVFCIVICIVRNLYCLTKE